MAFGRAELVGPWARPVVLRPGSAVKLGRAPTSDIVVDHPSVSRTHAQLEWRADGSVLLSDLGSSNGTRLDKTPVVKGTPVTLADGASIALGDVLLSLRFVAADAAPTSRTGKFDARASLRKLFVELERTSHAGSLELAYGEQKVLLGYDKGLVVAAKTAEGEGFAVLDEVIEGTWTHRGTYRISDALELERQPLRVRMTEVMSEEEPRQEPQRETERMKRHTERMRRLGS